jgi:hypothetical protein
MRWTRYTHCRRSDALVLRRRSHKLPMDSRKLCSNAIQRSNYIFTVVPILVYYWRYICENHLMCKRGMIMCLGVCGDWLGQSGQLGVWAWRKIFLSQTCFSRVLKLDNWLIMQYIIHEDFQTVRPWILMPTWVLMPKINLKIVGNVPESA